MATNPLYDSIGLGYAGVRQPDPRIAAQIRAALGPGASMVLNVGAGAGSYEPDEVFVVALEPSRAMIDQRRPTASRVVVQGVAGSLPFADDTFDAAMASLTVHHWPDPLGGLDELRRVTRGPVVVLTFDREVHDGQWLVTDYLPEMASLDADLPAPAEIASALGGGAVAAVPVPFDCLDGFCHAWWQRPEAYLDPQVRAGISGIARLPAEVVDAAMRRLGTDLADGTWRARHADLIAAAELDAGYRLVTSPGQANRAVVG